MPLPRRSSLIRRRRSCLAALGMLIVLSAGCTSTKYLDVDRAGAHSADGVWEDQRPNGDWDRVTIHLARNRTASCELTSADGTLTVLSRGTWQFLRPDPTSPQEQIFAAFGTEGESPWASICAQLHILANERGGAPRVMAGSLLDTSTGGPSAWIILERVHP